MELYSIIAGIITFAMVIHIINDKFFKLQTTIATTIGALIVSIILIITHVFGWLDWDTTLKATIRSVDFQDLLLNGMLGFLLFAGALTVDFKLLMKYKWEVLVLAFFGTAASTFLVGTGIFYLLHFVGHPLNYIYCLLFGALISPTDPIAVLATIKNVKAPESLNIKVAGESLFNDGIGLVIFVTLFSVAFSGGHPTVSSVSFLFLKEAIGGVVYGLILGCVAFQIIKRIHDPKLEILITVCIASAGYIFAQRHGISGPLAMVVAGLITGNHTRQHMLKKGEPHLTLFWELVEEVLNAVLFLLIGLEFLVLTIHLNTLIAGFITIPLVLLVRFITVAIPMSLFKLKKKYVPYVITVLTWGGLRGGLALAMALSLPHGHFRNEILLLTYVVVAFSIIVQGLTSKKLVKLSQGKDA